MILGSHTISVVRAPVVVDAYNNSVRNWASVSVVIVEECSVQPVVGQEVTVARDTVVSRWNLFAPYDTDLLATDRVRHNGVDYEVDGEVQRWDFPPLSYLSAVLKRGDA